MTGGKEQPRGRESKRPLRLYDNSLTFITFGVLLFLRHCNHTTCPTLGGWQSRIRESEFQMAKGRQLQYYRLSCFLHKP